MHNSVQLQMWMWVKIEMSKFHENTQYLFIIFLGISMYMFTYLCGAASHQVELEIREILLTPPPKCWDYIDVHHHV